MHLLDLAYYTGLILSSPLWAIPPKPRAKVMEALRNRMGHPPANLKSEISNSSHITIHLHAVSLGEINATRTLATELLARRPDIHLVITSTTQTGLARAQELYSGTPRISVERFPLDFSSAITRFLGRHKPAVSVLMELELWPNFLRLCCKHDIPVLLVNGRLSQHSMHRYKYIKPLAAGMMRSLHTLCVQDAIYAERFEAVGAPKEKIAITGTMKFDTAALSVDHTQVTQLATETGLPPEKRFASPLIKGSRTFSDEPPASGEDSEKRGREPFSADPVLVAGSTGPGEEAILLKIYRNLLNDYPPLRLVLVPRKPERFDEVAALIEQQGFPLTRRSQPKSAIHNSQSAIPPVVLGDTMGELRNFYALSTIVFVGRTLVDLGPKLHGSDMIEPAALGLPVLVGPHTANFADAMQLLRTNNAILEVTSESDLLAALQRLLADPAEREKLAQAAQHTVEKGKGATARHADRILNLLPPLAAPH